MAHEVGQLVLIDAAQTAGHMPVDVGKLGADLLAASGHKGLLGPLGTAILYIRPGLEMELRPVRQGGTGVESQLDHQPAEMPFRFEAGNLNTPALAGLGAAVRFLHERGVAETAAHEAALAAHLREGLTAVPGVRVYGPASARRCSAVVSFNVQGYDPQEFAAALDSAAGVQCRAGLHCAPRMHKALGTLESGGLVRLSLGWATTDAEVDHALAAIAAIAVA